MALSNMVRFNQHLMQATIETVAQMVEKFNEASNGAILLTSEGFYGDYMETSFYSSLHAAQRRVDRYAANAAQAGTALAQLQENSVKIAGGFGPIEFEPGQMTWMNKSEAEAIEMISRNLAEAILQDELNTAIAALVAAIENVAGLTNDVSATAPVTYSATNGAHALFGDRSMALIAQVMTGSTYHRFVGDNLTNTPQLFQAQNVLIVDILGKPAIITDAPALYEAGIPNKEKVLSLVAGAAMVSTNDDVITNVETSNGNERIVTTMQADYSFGLGLKGFSWDQANGGASPLDAEIATGTNWDQIVTSIKDTAGVITVGDADL